MGPQICTAPYQLISSPQQLSQGSVLAAEDKGEMVTVPGSSKHP